MNRGSSLPKIAAFIQRLAWILFLVSLPVTSFPYLPPALGGGALVRPLSIYPLIVLLLFSTIPHLFTRPLPKTLLSLLPFVLVAGISSALSLLRDIDPMLGISVSERVLRAILTLGIGGAFYFAVALTPRSAEDLRRSLRWLYLGLSAALLWGSLQAVYIVRFSQDYYKFLQDLQQFLSIRRLFTTRVSGMTYEPNWFAEQICLLLIPWLLASILSGYSAFNWSWRFRLLRREHQITLEWLLLGWAVVVLAFTFSRAGILNLFALFLLSILFLRPRRSAARARPTPLRRWVLPLAEAALAISALAGLIYFAGARNEFFARIWSYWAEQREHSLSGYFEYLGFGARFTYGETAFSVYTNNPVIGVGLGNYAYYFVENLPDTSLAETPEILRIVTPDAGRDRLITPKNFYYRLLAETGIIGAAAFFAFVVAVLGCALFLRLSSGQDERYWGTAGLLGLAAFAISALSFDSFALPNMWVIFGLVTASAWIFYRQGHPALAQAS